MFLDSSMPYSRDIEALKGAQGRGEEFGPGTSLWSLAMKYFPPTPPAKKDAEKATEIDAQTLLSPPAKSTRRPKTILRERHNDAEKDLERRYKCIKMYQHGTRPCWEILANANYCEPDGRGTYQAPDCSGTGRTNADYAFRK